MKKYVLLALLMVIGGVLSFAAFLALLNVCEPWKLFFQIVSSLGNGIFASAIITLLIEKGNDKRMKSKISEQKEYLLSDIRFMLPTILRNEIRTMSDYIAISKNNKSKMKTSDINFPSMLYSAQDLLNIINLEILNNNLISVNNEINGNVGLLNNDISSKLQELLDEYYKVNGEKEKIELNINELKGTRNDLQSEINELEINNRKQNSEYNKLMNEIRTLEVNISKEESKLDTYLLRLNEEYGMTYDKAKEYKLDLDLPDARIKVNNLKRDIKNLGDVNTGSIAEYERINTRYEFLTKQKEDLTGSINDLLEIINELDDTMKERLLSTFNALNNEFCKVFKKLFRGGEGKLVLLDENNILTSGLEIKACPPGKEIKSLKTLSGGEASMTALALLFATINIRTVPFCILDEAEAALDEANVDIFGNYLKEYDNKTQFIVITHKKRTMEYAGYLYGITMQESGVSKLVSVKLD